MSRARFIAAARLEFLAEVIDYSEAEAGLGVRFATAVEEASARSTRLSPKESSYSRLHTMRGVLITGSLVYVPANRRFDSDRFAAGHAGR